MPGIGGSRVAPLSGAEMSAWHAFIRAHARVVRRLEAELEAEHGLSMPAYEVLAHLSEAPNRRLRMSDLARCAILTPSGLTRLVDKLCRVGLVERVRCGEDGRVVYAALTTAGYDRLLAAYPTHLRGVRESFIDAVDPDALAVISSALGGLVQDVPATGAFERG